MRSVHLENLVFDAVDPQRLGRFWEAVLGTERLTDEPDGYETRLALSSGRFLDLCFQRVPEPPVDRPRLHLDLPAQQVDRLLALGAQRRDLGQAAGPWTGLADPEGNAFRVVQERADDAGSGPVAALRLDSADPDRDAAFWSWLTGWTEVPGVAPRWLRHPSRRGPLLELCREKAPKGAAKNRLHLDVRLDPGEDPDDAAAAITDRGGREVPSPWGELPWRLYVDPSGNEFCVLPARS